MEDSQSLKPISVFSWYDVSGCVIAEKLIRQGE